MTVQWSRLEQEVRNLDLEIPWPFTIDRFLLNVERFRGRKIRVIFFDSVFPTTSLDTVTQWWATGESDYIAVDKSAARLLQEQGIIHEASHMLLGHVGRPLIDTLASQFRFLSPHAVTRILARDVTAYSSPEESDAEALASLIPFAAHPDRSRSSLPWGAPHASLNQHYYQLYVACWPLWSEFVEVLNSPRLEALAPRPAGSRLMLHVRRLIIDVLDGLHHLRPHLAAQVAETARARALAGGHSMDTAQIIADASAIAAAIDQLASVTNCDNQTDSLNRIGVAAYQHELHSPAPGDSLLKVAYSLSLIAQAFQVSPIVHQMRHDAANKVRTAPGRRP